MNLEYLIGTVNETEFLTNDYLRGIADNYPQIIDTLFKILYYCGELSSVDTDYGEFQSFCFDSYVQIPYTAWVIFELYNKGYYLEAVTLLRNMLEVFVQLKYFFKYPDKISQHLTVRYISFSTMFNEFTSKDFYRIHYGHLLSSFAHGKLAKNIFRYERPSSNDRNTIMGCKFNPDNATYVMNQTIPLLFGYLSHFPIFFPNNTLGADKNISDYNNSVDWIRRFMADHKKTFPSSLSWYNDMDKLIYPQ